MGRNLSKQFDYINAKKIPFAIVVGPEEIKTKKLVLRDMNTGKEKKIKMEEIIKELQ